MKTKIVYVLVSSDKDIYLEQTLMSVFSLRNIQDDVEIDLVVDDRTEKNLSGKRAKIKDYIDNIISIHFDDSIGNLQRSRLLKTGLREYIDGDFLYIDGDTIVIDNLGEIDNCPYSIGAVIACHINYKHYYAKDELDRLFDKLGFSVEEYFNGGVIYCKDDQIGNKFFSLWHQYYAENMNTIRADMPSMAKANSEMNVIKEIDGIWNCQIMYGNRYLPKAKILHYFASNFVDSNRDFPFLFMDKNLFMKIKNNGDITEDIEELIGNAKCLWSDKIEVIGGDEINIYHSRSMKILRKIYYDHKFIYNKIERVLAFAANRKNS